MRPGLSRYLLGISVPAGAAALLLAIGSAGRAGDPVLALILVALAVVAANYQVMVTPRYKADTGPAVYFAMVLLYPPAAAVALVGLGALGGEALLMLRRRRVPIDVVFNTGQLMLCGAAGALVFRWIESAFPGDLTMIPAGALAACAMYAVSTVLVGIAVAMHHSRRLRDVLGEMVAGVLLMVLAWRSPWLAAVMMVPIGGVHLSLKRSMQLREQTVAAVESMADLVDRRDPYTFQHSRSVAQHAVTIARRLQLPEGEIELIGLAARVHDLGKIATPDAVLHKAGRLTDEEFAVMKKHPNDGAEILAKFPEYRRGRELVLSHHERIDGRGYPRGLRGDAIPLGARIIAVADAWDAMTSDRPYRSALPESVALAELMRGRGTQWDGSVVDAFAATLPAAEPEPVERREGIAAPVLRSLGAVAGLLG
jgi:putative nucleotidyltransferase with HDIG domain